jgi:hypothetical protein
MENLFNDSSFEVYHNSEGAKILGWDRTLMQYPNEKNSFDVFMGFTDENKDGKDDKSGKTQEEIAKEKEKEKAEREEKIKQYASIGKDVVQTGQSVAGAVKSFETKQKQDLKAVCGRKPILKKNRPPYDKCVENYMASLSGGGDTGGDTGGKKSADITDEKPKSNTTKYIIAGVIVLGLIGGFIYLKKTGKI